jgi:hypothetical protein
MNVKERMSPEDRSTTAQCIWIIDHGHSVSTRFLHSIDAGDGRLRAVHMTPTHQNPGSGLAAEQVPLYDLHVDPRAEVASGILEDRDCIHLEQPRSITLNVCFLYGKHIRARVDLLQKRPHTVATTSSMLAHDLGFAIVQVPEQSTHGRTQGLSTTLFSCFESNDATGIHL